MTNILTERTARERVKLALSRIAKTRDTDGKIVVDLPIMYPSGAMAVIEIERNRDKYWVSDMGYGMVEAEFMAAQSFYASSARRISKEYGVDFDGSAVFALWVPESRLEAAIVCVANASNLASSEAIRRASEAHGHRQNEQIFDRIKRVFGEHSVSKTAELTGRHAAWEAHNVVVLADRRKAVFEFVKPHANSIASKFWMFTDLKAADKLISLNVVVDRLDQLDEKGQMIGDVANIINIDASDEHFRQFALAS